jgi:hypothetical protein
LHVLKVRSSNVERIANFFHFSDKI